MTILSEIESDRMTSRKNKDRDLTALLTTLYSEIGMVGKNDGGRLSTDDEAVIVIKKFIKNANMSLHSLRKMETERSVISIDELETELVILNSYLPKQLTDIELNDAIKGIIADIDEPTPRVMGMVMKQLKAEKGDTYDGKLASMIVKDLLNRKV